MITNYPPLWARAHIIFFQLEGWRRLVLKLEFSFWELQQCREVCLHPPYCRLPCTLWLWPSSEHKKEGWKQMSVFIQEGDNQPAACRSFSFQASVRGTCTFHQESELNMWGESTWFGKTQNQKNRRGESIRELPVGFLLSEEVSKL
jgi:hypothetical protein